MSRQRKQSGFNGITQAKRAKYISSMKASLKKKNKKEEKAKNVRNALKKQRDKYAQQNALKLSGELKSVSKKPKKKSLPKTDYQKKLLAEKVKKNRKKELDKAKERKYKTHI